MDFLLHLTYGGRVVSIRKRPFCPIAALLSRRKMLTYRMYVEFMLACGCFFRLLRALHSNKIARFRMDTRVKIFRLVHSCIMLLTKNCATPFAGFPLRFANNEGGSA